MKSWFTAFLVAAVLAATGCVRRDDVSVVSVRVADFTIGTSPSVVLAAEVENRSGCDITVRDIAFMATDAAGETIGRVVGPEQVVVPRKSAGEVTVPLRIRLDSPLGILGLIGDWEDASRELRFSGGATVRAGLLKKRVKIEDMTLDELRDSLSEFAGGDMGSATIDI